MDSHQIHGNGQAQQSVCIKDGSSQTFINKSKFDRITSFRLSALISPPITSNIASDYQSGHIQLSFLFLMSVRKSTCKAASKINSSIATIAADEDEDEEEQLNDADDEEEGSNDENEGSEDDDEDQNVVPGKRKHRVSDPMSYATHEDNEDSDDAKDLQDDEEYDDDDNDDNLPVKSKSKKRARRSSSMESVTQKKTRGPAKKTEPAAKKSKKPTTTDILSLKSDQAFDTLKAQILARIAESLKPGQLHYEDYDISFTVPRQVTDSLSLDSPEKYQHLVLNALKIKADPSARISVVPKSGRVIINNKNAEVDSDEDDPKKKTKGKRRKTTIPNARRILPGNVALNEKMGLIRARSRWLCPTPGGPCGSEHCYVQPDAVEHFPLSHAHVVCWAAAWLKDKNFANENKPPNHKLFDGLNDESLRIRSPLLQRRLDLQNKKKVPAAAPQVNFNFPPELIQLFRQPAPAPAPSPARAPAAVPFHAHVPMLIPAPFVPGPNLSIEDFCAKHDLDDDICARFKSNKFNRTDSFRYIELTDLKAMSFMPGEIAELKVAIAAWAQHP
ncbi:hypothetical protein C8R44DRAFT_741948 [Mycena epipterygia]|nr:hypothetical protein C8R44DRAFT_741948 [Mycena epipterygia]